ncbi:hypothetical protein [Lacunimicrobium album]
MSILIDTNCLIRLADPAHSDHSVISNAVSTLQPTNGEHQAKKIASLTSFI